MEKPNKCFACGYEVPENVEYYKEFQEVLYVREDEYSVDPFNPVTSLYACPCCGTVRATFNNGYQDKEEICKRRNTNDSTTSKLDFGGLCGKHI